MRLTQQTIDGLKLPVGRSELIIFDERLPGFGIRLRESGKRTWIAQYRIAGAQRRVTLGKVDAVDPKKAFEAAKRTLEKVQLGDDPGAEKALAKARAAITFGAVAQRYIDDVASVRQRPRSLTATKRYLLVLWAPLKGLPIGSIHRATIATRLHEIAKKNGPVAANRARQSLSAFFGWAMREGLTETNPVLATNRPAEERPRERVLADNEIAAIWRACRDDSFGRIVRLLILTGQRRDEVGGIARSEVDAERALWRLPPSRTKNGRPHDVPLAPAALAILEAAPTQEGRDRYFGEGDSPFQSWSSAKRGLDQRIAASGAELKPWTLHDLRRTAATVMAEHLSILPHVIEAVLNHVSGHKGGVAGIYNRATYSVEKRQALERWAEHVAAIVEGRESSVLTFKARA